MKQTVDLMERQRWVKLADGKSEELPHPWPLHIEQGHIRPHAC